MKHIDILRETELPWYMFLAIDILIEIAESKEITKHMYERIDALLKEFRRIK